jgi:hypothetical protein
VSGGGQEGPEWVGGCPTLGISCADMGLVDPVRCWARPGALSRAEEHFGWALSLLLLRKKNCVHPAARRRVLPRSARLSIFTLSIAASVSLCTDPAAGGVPLPAGSLPEFVCSRRFRRVQSRSDVYAAGGKDEARISPGYLKPIGIGLVVQGLRGGGPGRMNQNAPFTWPEHAAPAPPYASAWAPGASSSWAPTSLQSAGGATPYDALPPALDPHSSWNAEATGRRTAWLVEILAAEPVVAQVAGDLAVGGDSNPPVSFPSHGAFASAAKTVAFLVGSASRDPREAAWRKVRRSNPALSQRLGQEGFRLLQSCGYSIEQRLRGDEVFYVLNGAYTPRTLQALETMLLAAAHYGHGWLRSEYLRWIEETQYPVLGGLASARVGFDYTRNSGAHMNHSRLRERSMGMRRGYTQARAVRDVGSYSALHSEGGVRDGAYARIFVQQRAASLMRARQQLLLAMQVESWNQTVSPHGPAESKEQHHLASTDAWTRQALDAARGALTCTCSCADSMHRTLAGKQGAAAGYAGGGAAVSVRNSGFVDGRGVEQSGDLVLLADMNAKCKQTLREVAACQQRLTDAAQHRKREVQRAGEVDAARAEAERVLRLVSDRENAAIVRCQDLEDSLAAETANMDALFQQIRSGLSLDADGMPNHAEAFAPDLGVEMRDPRLGYHAARGDVSGVGQALSRAAAACEKAKIDLAGARKQVAVAEGGRMQVRQCQGGDMYGCRAVAARCCGLFVSPVCFC